MAISFFMEEPRLTEDMMTPEASRNCVELELEMRT